MGALSITSLGLEGHDLIADTDLHIAGPEPSSGAVPGATYHSDVELWILAVPRNDGASSTATFGAGCVAPVGDAPPDGTVIGAVGHTGPLTRIRLSAGEIFAYAIRR